MTILLSVRLAGFRSLNDDPECMTISVRSIAHYTSWFTAAVERVISPARQEDIVQDLLRAPGLCIVYDLTSLKQFDRGQIATDPPLLRYLRSDFVAKAQRH